MYVWERIAFGLSLVHSKCHSCTHNCSLGLLQFITERGLPEFKVIALFYQVSKALSYSLSWFNSRPIFQLTCKLPQWDTASHSSNFLRISPVQTSHVSHDNGRVHTVYPDLEARIGQWKTKAGWIHACHQITFPEEKTLLWSTHLSIQRILTLTRVRLKPWLWIVHLAYSRDRIPSDLLLWVR